MVSVILLVGIATLTSAQTTAMRWIGLAILVASAASGWAAWHRAAMLRKEREMNGETRTGKAVNLLINILLAGMLMTMVAVLIIKHTVGLPTS